MRYRLLRHKAAKHPLRSMFLYKWQCLQISVLVCSQAVEQCDWLPLLQIPDKENFRPGYFAYPDICGQCLAAVPKAPCILTFLCLRPTLRYQQSTHERFAPIFGRQKKGIFGLFFFLLFEPKQVC